MSLTNAHKQKRWRERRNSRADALTGTPKEIANRILRVLGPEEAEKILRALEARLRNVKSDCSVCCGTGFMHLTTQTACGRPLPFRPILPCDCGPLAEALIVPPSP